MAALLKPIWKDASKDTYEVGINVRGRLRRSVPDAVLENSGPRDDGFGRRRSVISRTDSLTKSGDKSLHSKVVFGRGHRWSSIDGLSLIHGG